jgi:predicted peptidase
MDKNKAPFTWIDWLLSAAIAGNSVLLLALLCEPAIGAWVNRPRPGAQVPQQYIVKQADYADAEVPIDYLLYLPPDYDAGKKWPLVVFLHGAGERGQNLEVVRRTTLPRMVEHDDRRQWGFVLLSPQCPKDSSWNPQWVVELVDHVGSRLSIDQDRIYLTGYSMGGFGTWATACHDPDRFAAIATLSGGGDVQQAQRLKALPIWAFHGDKDNVVPIASSQNMVDAVRKCGGNAVFTVYPGAGHGICDMTYGNNQFWDWLLAQRRKGPLR